MKEIICIYLSLFFVQIAWAQAKPLAELVDGIEQMVKKNGHIIRPSDQRLIRQNIQDIRRIFADYGITPGTSDKVSRIFSCTNDRNPRLFRYIVNLTGTFLRTDVLQVYSEGFQDDKKRACEAQLNQSSLAESAQGLCQCSPDSSPTLVLELIDEDYQTVRKINLNQFTTGFLDEQKKDCEKMRTSLTICTGI